MACFNLTVVIKEHYEKFGYWYIITDSSTNHTAFKTLQGLHRWLDERGLIITAPITEPGVFSTQKLVGDYKISMHSNPEEFYALPAIIETKTLSNGDYTLARITESDGIRTVHILNPNISRVIFDYAASEKIMG